MQCTPMDSDMDRYDTAYGTKPTASCGRSMTGFGHGILTWRRERYGEVEVAICDFLSVSLATVLRYPWHTKRAMEKAAGWPTEILEDIEAHAYNVHTVMIHGRQPRHSRLENP